MLVLKALFTDNNNYGKELYCGDEFVEAISWLCEHNDEDKYSLDSKLNMPVFMTAVVYFVEAALGPHGKVNVNENIENILSDESGEYSIGYFGYSIRIIKDKNEIFYRYECVDSFKVETILWAAYLYMDIMSHIMRDEDKKKYNENKDILYKALLEQSGLKESYFRKQHFLWTKNEQTLLKFRLELGKHNEEKAPNIENVDSQKEISELKKTITQQKKEIECLKQDLNDLRNKNKAMLTTREYVAIALLNLPQSTQYEKEIYLALISDYSPTSFNNHWADFTREKDICKQATERMQTKYDELKEKYPPK